MGKGVSIGLTNLTVAVLAADIAPTTVGGIDGYAVYFDPQRILGVISANFAPNASNDTLFADDGPYDAASTLGAMTLEINVADIEPAMQAVLFGHTYVNGVIQAGAADVPPYVAMGMSVARSNGSKKLLWYLKGKFAEPDDSNQTKADSTNWVTPTTTGNFLRRDFDNQYKFSANTDDATLPALTITNWFKSPNVPLKSTCELPTITPSTGGTITPGTTTITVASTTEGATFKYKLLGDADWTTYATNIATTGWTGTVVLLVKASKTDMADSYSAAKYVIGA